MKNGTPDGTQLDCAVNALFLPARISSMSFFMRSFTQGFRFGLERSAMRKLGWPWPLATKGCAGSLTMGGRRPGTNSKNGPPPFIPTQPSKLDEKSGGVLCCATVDEAGTAMMRIASMLRARNFFLPVNEAIITPPQFWRDYSTGIRPHR